VLPPYFEAARYRKEITMSTATLTIPFTDYESLAQLRDDLRVRIHLGEMEARDQWERLEPKWWELQRKVAAVERASADTAQEITTAGNLLIEELSKGYDRIHKAL
jgi:predicted RNA-binding protein